MPNDDTSAAPVIRLLTEEDAARAREHLEALQNAAPASIDALIRVGLENALRALDAVSPEKGLVNRPKEMPQIRVDRDA
jgi:hypothetical protein